MKRNWISEASTIYKGLPYILSDDVLRKRLVNILKKQWVTNHNWWDKSNYYEMTYTDTNIYQKIKSLVLNKGVEFTEDVYEMIPPMKSADLGITPVLGMIWKMQLNLLLSVKKRHDLVTVITTNGFVVTPLKDIGTHINSLSSEYVGVYMYKDIHDYNIMILFDVSLSNIHQLIDVLDKS